MKNTITVKNENGDVVAKVGIDAVRFEMISDRLDYSWALWEVNVAMPDGDCVTGFMQACHSVMSSHLILYLWVGASLAFYLTRKR